MIEWIGVIKDKKVFCKLYFSENGRELDGTGYNIDDGKKFSLKG